MADEAVLEQQTTTESAAPVESQASTPASSTPSRASSAIEAMATGGGEETAHLNDGGQAQPSFADQLAEFGEEFKGITDPVAAQTRLLEHARALRQQQQELTAWQQRATPYVQYGQQYAQLARDPEYQAWLASRQAGKQQPQQNQPESVQEQPKKWWNPPAFDKNSLTNYIEHVVDPATNEVVPRFKSDTPIDVRTAYAAHQKYLNEWADGLATRPHEVIPQIIQQEVGPLIEQALAQREQQQQQRAFLQGVTTQNADWLYQKDANGQFIVDPVTNQPAFSQAGDRVKNFAQWLSSPEAQTPQGRWWAATKLLYGETLEQSQAQQSAQQSVADVAAQKKAEALGRGANHIPDRGGSNPRPQSSKQVPQNRRLSAGQRLAAAMTRDGLDSISPAELFGTGV